MPIYPVKSGSGSFKNSPKLHIKHNFHAVETPLSEINSHDLKEDTLIENNFKNRAKIKISKTLDIPFVHFPRGLKGASDFTFYEFLQTAKFPYYVGGPILAALFYAGVNKDNFKSASAASKVAKHMALGVGFYYLGAAIAKSIINTTVKISRGMDLNHPYAKATTNASTNKAGVFNKKVEFHSAFESSDFTRTDLLYNKKGKTPEEINEKYIELGKKFGVKGNPADIDQTVKPLIKKTITMARAWQYALTAFYVTLGIGMANQKAWDKASPEGFKNTVKYGIFGKGVPFKSRLENIKTVVYDNMIKPFGKSFKEFWTGQSKVSSIAGKSVILSTVAATLLAIGLIVGKTSAKKHAIPADEKNGGSK